MKGKQSSAKRAKRSDTKKKPTKEEEKRKLRTKKQTENRESDSEFDVSSESEVSDVDDLSDFEGKNSSESDVEEDEEKAESEEEESDNESDDDNRNNNNNNNNNNRNNKKRKWKNTKKFPRRRGGQSKNNLHKFAAPVPESDLELWELSKQNEKTADMPPEQLNPNISMLKFQLESLAWMQQQERNEKWKGGILADEMGMGKTLQAIALILKRSTDKDAHHNGVRTTLVLCPVVAMAQWVKEIEKYTKPNSLRVTVYHGANRVDKDALTQYDVVITSYSIVESEYRMENKGYKRKGEIIKKPSTLHSIEWNRIILDEAHFIKDRSRSTSQAVCHLEAKYRWSLTGTPLQNRIGELLSIVKFLRVLPYSFYFCKKCDCQSIHWKFKKGEGCQGCGHGVTAHFAWWNRHILNPIKNDGMNSEEGQYGIRVLKYILNQVMLRRTKLEKADDLCLPPRIIRIRKDELDIEENDFYEALYTQSKTSFNNFVSEGTILNNYAHVFDLLLRLRQAVDHPYLVLHSKDRATDKGTEWCKLCREPAEDPIQSKCKHVFCRVCMEQYLNQFNNDDSDDKRHSKGTTCPECALPLTIDLTQKSLYDEMPNKPKQTQKTILERVDLANWRSSTKIEAMMEELHKIQAHNPNAKTLIFSQFTNFLDLIDWRLKMSGFGCIKLDGRLTAEQKKLAIEKFNTDPNTTVFLISLKAGGFALNLTVASHCFLMDPWWNPAAEFQAIDRIHRLGQFKCISVVRFIIPNTIEERIMQLQEKKHLLFNSTVGMDNDALARLSLQDLQFLFH